MQYASLFESQKAEAYVILIFYQQVLHLAPLLIMSDSNADHLASQLRVIFLVQDLLQGLLLQLFQILSLICRRSIPSIPAISDTKT